MSAIRTAPLAGLLLLALAPAARADLTPPLLLSATAREQADVAKSPALSADGRFVAFRGVVGGVSGVFRRDLLGGAIELVAGGDAYGAQPGSATDAELPSISADGRYVAFATTARLDAANDLGEARDVYVRDMTRPLDACDAQAQRPCAYELASALDGGRAGLSYDGPGGTSLASGVALSGDGRRVVFVTAAVSDLTSAPGGSTPGVPTPAGQVVARDLDTLRTTLVSSERDALSGAMTGRPVPQGAVAATVAAFAPRALGLGAAISADGTTVAWLGSAISAQAPTLADEPRADGSLAYDEPLWRRIADGPAAPTRRVVGGGDPLAPGCPPGGTLAIAACQGPFPQLARIELRRDNTQPAGWLNPANLVVGVPRLSADGRAVALIGDPSAATNVFLVDMRDGLTRAQAVRQLTREVPLPFPQDSGGVNVLAQTGDVMDLAISPDGRRLAFATARTRFPLAPPRLLGSAPTRIGVTELYRIDLDADALERISVPPAGGPSLQPGGFPTDGDGATAPSFSGSGRTLVFASTAVNLVAGDANAASDLFRVDDVIVPQTPGAEQRTPPPARLRFAPEWQLSVRAVSLRDGRVRIDAVVPAAGRLTAAARARVTVKTGSGRKRRTRVLTRAVASGARRLRADGAVSLPLRLTAKERARARTRRGLTATVAVRFSGAGGRPLRDTLSVRFRVSRAAARRGPASRRGRR